MSSVIRIIVFCKREKYGEGGEVERTEVGELWWDEDVVYEYSRRSRWLELESDFKFTFSAVVSSRCASGTAGISVLTFFGGSFLLTASFFSEILWKMVIL